MLLSCCSPAAHAEIDHGPCIQFLLLFAALDHVRIMFAEGQKFFGEGGIASSYVDASAMPDASLENSPEADVTEYEKVDQAGTGDTV